MTDFKFVFVGGYATVCFEMKLWRRLSDWMSWHFMRGQHLPGTQMSQSVSALRDLNTKHLRDKWLVSIRLFSWKENIFLSYALNSSLAFLEAYSIVNILTKQGEGPREGRAGTGYRIIKCCHLLVVDDDVSTKRQFLLSVHCVWGKRGDTRLLLWSGSPISMSEYFLSEQDVSPVAPQDIMPHFSRLKFYPLDNVNNFPKIRIEETCNNMP